MSSSNSRATNVAAIGGVIITALALAYNVWIKQSEPTPTVEATIIPSEFDWPPITDSAFLARLSFDDSYLRGYYHVIVRNVGSRTSRDVVLRIPHLRMWCLVREARSEQCRVAPTRIDVGDLSVGESATIRAWTTHQPGVFAADASVAHQDGLGTTKIVPVVKMPTLFDRYWFTIVWALMLLGLARLLFSRALQDRGKADTEGRPPNAKEEAPSVSAASPLSDDSTSAT